MQGGSDSWGSSGLTGLEGDRKTGQDVRTANGRFVHFDCEGLSAMAPCLTPRPPCAWFYVGWESSRRIHALADVESNTHTAERAFANALDDSVHYPTSIMFSMHAAQREGHQPP
jgi:hypothetical protein